MTTALGRCTRVSRLVANYLGIIPRPQDRLLVVHGCQVHPNSWMIVAAVCQFALGPHSNFNIAFDPRNRVCFVMCGLVDDAEYLHHCLFHVNNEDQVNFSFVSSRNLYIDSSDEGLGFNKFGLSRTTEIKGPDDEELSMTDLVMGSDEELAFQMSQMEFKSQADEDHSLAELMSRLKDVASESSGSASRPPSPPDQADEP